MAPPKVLLVDDVKLLIELEKSFLKHSPVRILTASNGEEALKVIRQELPDLIYMDLNMPKMDGKSCCNIIKSDPELRSIPVIMVTTAGSRADEQRCREAGCDDFITKPIDRRMFLGKGRHYIPDIDRRDQRVACLTEISLAGGIALGTATSADISIGGIYVASDQKPQPDGELQISFTLPGTAVKVEAKGRVAWTNSGTVREKQKLPPGFGLEFTEINTDVIKAIRNYIEEKRISGER